MIPKTQTAVQLVGPDELVLNSDKPVYQPGPHQILAMVECVGLCFSDMKLLHAFTGHARKGPILSGIDPDTLKEIPSYVPNKLPTVPGHEVVVRIVEVGEGVTKFAVGERYLVQTDYRHLPTDGSKAAFGYNFEGALQQYVLMDERVIIAPDGESFLLPVSEEPSASAIALAEPWACVEDSYNTQERQSIKAGGKLLIVLEDGDYDLRGLSPSDGMPSFITAVGFDETPMKQYHVPVTSADSIGDDAYDDILYLGCKAETIELLSDRLADRGILNVATAGRDIDKPAMIDVGRIHYGGTRYIGTSSNRPAEAYSCIPATGEILCCADVLIVGAAGPMGTMHTIRAIALPEHPKTITGTDINSERLEILADSVKAAAERKGVEFISHNPKESGNYTGKADYAVFLPPLHSLLPPVIQNLKPGGVLNIFAGIRAGNKAPIDMDYYVKNSLYMIGTSGSTVEDMRIVLEKVNSKQLDTNASVAAVSGMKGAIEGLNGVDKQRFHGKVIVYPQLTDMDLIELSDLPQDVADHLEDGVWTRKAEQALINQ
ncbi:alcohol dehydrogenase catalytic domain-containing protein [Candidatus Poribacteria bacterium]